MSLFQRSVLVLLLTVVLCLAGLSAARLGQILWSGGTHYDRLSAEAERLVEQVTGLQAGEGAGQLTDQARAAVARRVESMPLDPAGHFLHFQLARFGGDRAAASQALLRCTLARPADSSLAYAFGIHLLEGGQFREGLASFRRSLLLGTDHLDDIYQDCMGIFARRYDAFRFIFPEETELHERLGELLRRDRLVDQSIEEYRWCLARNPDSAGIHFKLSLVCREDGRTAEALAAVEEALRLEPGRSEYLCDRGEYLLRLGRTGEALAAGRSLVTADPGFEEGHMLLARCYEKQGETWEAIRVYREALWKVGEKGAIHRLLGDQYLEADLHQQALEEYRAAVTEATGEYERKFALYRTAICLEEMGLGSRALEALVEADAIRPKSKGLDRPVAEAIERINSGDPPA